MAALWYVLTDHRGRQWCAPREAALLGFVAAINRDALAHCGAIGKPRPALEPWTYARPISGRPLPGDRP